MGLFSKKEKVNFKETHKILIGYIGYDENTTTFKVTTLGLAKKYVKADEIADIVIQYGSLLLPVTLVKSQFETTKDMLDFMSKDINVNKYEGSIRITLKLKDGKPVNMSPLTLGKYIDTRLFLQAKQIVEGIEKFI